MASSRSRAASIRSGRSARRSKMPRCCLEAIAGHDPRDSTSLNVPVPAYSQSVNKPLANLRIGWVREHFGPGLDGEVEKSVRAALEVYKSLGATLQEISLPHSKYAVATYYVIAPSEASSNLARYDGVHFGYRTNEKEMLAELAAERKQLEAAGDKVGLDDLDSALVRMYRRTRAEGFGPEVKRRIMLGTYALSAGYYDAYYLKALKVRRLIRQDFDRAFEKVDLIAGPITPSPAFKIGEMAGRSAGDVPGRPLHRERQPRRHCRASACRAAIKSGLADRPAAASSGVGRRSAACAARMFE